MKRLLVDWKIWLIVMVALMMRLPHLNGSFWLDEAAQAWESSRPWDQQFNIIEDFQPPLLHLLLYFAVRIDTSEWWLRTIGALIPGLVTVFGTYLIGARIFNPKVGLISSLLLATSSFHIFYSQELRPYSLPAMWAVLSWWCLIELKLQKKGLNWHWSLPFISMSILGCYSSYLYPFLLLSQLIYLFWFQTKLRWLSVMTCLGVFVAFLPWLPTFRQQLRVGGMVRQELPGWAEVVSIPQLKSLPLVFGKFLFGVLNLEMNLVFGVVLLIIVGLLARQILSFIKANKKVSDYWIFLVWLGVPLVSSWLLSFWIPVVQPKRVLFLLPTFYLLLAGLSTELSVWSIKKEKVLYALIGLVLGINVFSSFQYYFNPRLQRENWRSLHQEIVTRYSPQSSVVVFSFPGPFAPWAWYDDGTFPTLSTGTLHVDQVQSLRETLEPAAEKRYILVFDYLRDLSDPEDKILKELTAYGYVQVDVIDYPNIGFVRVLAKPESVISSFVKS